MCLVDNDLITAQCGSYTQYIVRIGYVKGLVPVGPRLWLVRMPFAFLQESRVLYA